MAAPAGSFLRTNIRKIESALASTVTSSCLETCHRQRKCNDPHEKRPQYVQHPVLPHVIDDVHVTHLTHLLCRTFGLVNQLVHCCPAQSMTCYRLGRVSRHRLKDGFAIHRSGEKRGWSARLTCPAKRTEPPRHARRRRASDKCDAGAF